MDYSNLIKPDQHKIESLKEEALIKIKDSHRFDIFIAENNITDQEIKDNVSKFLTLLNSEENCKSCKSLNECKNRIPQIVLDLSFDKDTRMIDYVYQVCDKKRRFELLDDAFLIRDFPNQMFDFKLKDAILVNAKMRTKLISFLSSCLLNDDVKSCYVHGNMRIGKTFIMSCFAVELANRHKTNIAFVNFPKFCASLIDLVYNDKNAFYEELDKVKKASILFIDNFGNESRTDFVKDSIIYPLIFERFSNNLPTFYTSNYTLEEIQTMYSTSKAAAPRARMMVETIRSDAKQFYLEGLPYYAK